MLLPTKVLSISSSIWQHLFQHFFSIISFVLDELTQRSPVKHIFTGQRVNWDHLPVEKSKATDSLTLQHFYDISSNSRKAKSGPVVKPLPVLQQFFCRHAFEDGFQRVHRRICTVFHIQSVEQLDDITVQAEQPGWQEAAADHLSHCLCTET